MGSIPITFPLIRFGTGDPNMGEHEENILTLNEQLNQLKDIYIELKSVLEQLKIEFRKGQFDYQLKQVDEQIRNINICLRAVAKDSSRSALHERKEEFLRILEFKNELIYIIDNLNKEFKLDLDDEDEPFDNQ